MITFKQFIESYDTSIVPSSPDMSLEAYLQSLVGSSIKEILNTSSRVNLYIGNKYGVGGNVPLRDKNLRGFTDALVRFVNKDILKYRPTHRIYDTQEFKDKHNFKEFDDLSKQRLELFKVLRNSTRSEAEHLLKQKRDIEDRAFSTEYWKAKEAADKDYDRAVNEFHNKPLKAEDLQDDGSSDYRKLERAYEALRNDEEQDPNVVDV